MTDDKSVRETAVRARGRSVMVLLACALIGATGAAAQTVYYHADMAGSPIAATGESGELLWKESYRPYGERVLKPASANTQWFHGKPMDAATGMQDFGSRNYDPIVGRFLSIDPVDVSPGKLHSFNRYAYGNNNPLKYVDPDGNDAVLVFNKDGSLNITLPIKFSGPGATPANIAAMKQNIESNWTGNYTVDGKSMDVKLNVTDTAVNGKLNEITLTDGPTSLAGGTSFVREARTGEWNVQAAGMKLNEAAHEAGHLMGAKDRYVEAKDANGNRITPPVDGFRGNLMAESSGKPDGRNVEEIVKTQAEKVSWFARLFGGGP